MKKAIAIFTGAALLLAIFYEPKTLILVVGVGLMVLSVYPSRRRR